MLNKIGITPLNNATTAIHHTLDALSRSFSEGSSRSGSQRDAVSGRTVSNRSGFHTARSVVSTRTSFFRSNRTQQGDDSARPSKPQPTARERKVMEKQRTRHEEVILEHLDRIEIVIEDEVQKECQSLLSLLRRTLEADTVVIAHGNVMKMLFEDKRVRASSSAAGTHPESLESGSARPDVGPCYESIPEESSAKMSSLRQPASTDSSLKHIVSYQSVFPSIDSPSPATRTPQPDSPQQSVSHLSSLNYPPARVIFASDDLHADVRVSSLAKSNLNGKVRSFICVRVRVGPMMTKSEQPHMRFHNFHSKPAIRWCSLLILSTSPKRSLSSDSLRLINEIVNLIEEKYARRRREMLENTRNSLSMVVSMLLTLKPALDDMKSILENMNVHRTAIELAFGIHSKRVDDRNGPLLSSIAEEQESDKSGALTVRWQAKQCQDLSRRCDQLLVLVAKLTEGNSRLSLSIERTLTVAALCLAQAASKSFDISKCVTHANKGLVASMNELFTQYERYYHTQAFESSPRIPNKKEDRDTESELHALVAEIEESTSSKKRRGRRRRRSATSSSPSSMSSRTSSMSNALLWQFRVHSSMANAPHTTYYTHIAVFLHTVVALWKSMALTTQIEVSYEETDMRVVSRNYEYLLGASSRRQSGPPNNGVSSDQVQGSSRYDDEVQYTHRLRRDSSEDPNDSPRSSKAGINKSSSQSQKSASAAQSPLSLHAQFSLDHPARTNAYCVVEGFVVISIYFPDEPGNEHVLNSLAAAEESESERSKSLSSSYVSEGPSEGTDSLFAEVQSFLSLMNLSLQRVSPSSSAQSEQIEDMMSLRDVVHKGYTLRVPCTLFLNQNEYNGYFFPKHLGIQVSMPLRTPRPSKPSRIASATAQRERAEEKDRQLEQKYGRLLSSMIRFTSTTDFSSWLKWGDSYEAPPINRDDELLDLGFKRSSSILSLISMSGSSSGKHKSTGRSNNLSRGAFGSMLSSLWRKSSDENSFMTAPSELPEGSTGL